jgi:hypothetical protein
MPWFKLDGSIVGCLLPLRGAPLSVLLAAGLAADQDGMTEVSLMELARTTGYGRRAVASAIQLLERSGLLRTVTAASGRRSARQVHRCLCWGTAQPQTAPLAELWQAVTPDDPEIRLPWPPHDKHEKDR